MGMTNEELEALDEWAFVNQYGDVAELLCYDKCGPVLGSCPDD